MFRNGILAISVVLLLATLFAVPTNARPIMCGCLEDREYCEYHYLNVIVIRVKYASGSPVVGATVRLYDRHNNLVEQGTTGLGGYWVTWQEHGRYKARVSKSGLSTKEVSFRTDRWYTIVEVTMSEAPPPEYDVTIQVRHEDGSGIGGSSVTIYQGGSPVKSGTANGAGNYQTSLEAGTYNVTVVSASNGATKSQGFSVSGDTSVTVTFNDRVRITVYKNGSPLEGATVTILGTLYETTTGPDGVADFGCGILQPSTSYKAHIQKPSELIDHTENFMTNKDGGANITVEL